MSTTSAPLMRMTRTLNSAISVLSTFTVHQGPSLTTSACGRTARRRFAFGSGCSPEARSPRRSYQHGCSCRGGYAELHSQEQHCQRPAVVDAHPHCLNECRDLIHSCAAPKHVSGLLAKGFLLTQLILHTFGAIGHSCSQAGHNHEFYW